MSTRYRIIYYEPNQAGGQPLERKPEYDHLVFVQTDLKAIKERAAAGYPVVVEKLEIQELEFWRKPLSQGG